MVPTNLYRTRHEFFNIPMQLPKAPKFIVGLDAGYSGMKVWYERGYFCFPSFVKELTDESLNLFDEKDIYLHHHIYGFYQVFRKIAFF